MDLRRVNTIGLADPYANLITDLGRANRSKTLDLPQHVPLASWCFPFIRSGAGKTLEGANMAWNTVDDWKAALDPLMMTDFFMDTAIPSTVDAALADDKWEVIFHQYSKAEFNSENLEFLGAVKNFEQSGDLNYAAEVYRTYVAAGSANQINLSGPNRLALDEIFGEGKDGIGPPNLFDDAKTNIMLSVVQDLFPRFQASATKAQADMWSAGGREHS